ncbi:MAG TPA: hypothetical protein VFD59_10110 [Nocardioidaceae bacterium]|nr:hypothetical protein [Nocardioidaceae bacterium]
MRARSGGVAAAVIVGQVLRKGAGTSIAAAVLTMLLHEIADAPVAGYLDDAGI